MLNGLTAAGTGNTLALIRDQEVRWEALLTGDGDVSAEWRIEYVDGGGAWQTFRTEGMAGADSVTKGARFRAPGTQMRAVLDSISGTDAALTVTAYTTGGAIQPVVERAAAAGIHDVDAGRVIVTTDSNGATLHVVAPIAQGFRCTVIQGGAGAITIDGTNVTLHNRQSHALTAGQYAVVTLTATADDVVVLAGDTASGGS